MGHGNTSCDPHLHLSHQATKRSTTSREASAAGRLRPNSNSGQVKFVAESSRPLLQELVDKSFQIKKSSWTSSWHYRRVEDAVGAYRELAASFDKLLIPFALVSSANKSGSRTRSQRS